MGNGTPGGKRGGFLLLDEREDTGRCTFPNSSTQYVICIPLVLVHDTLSSPRFFFSL